jgi:hypothetical protein
MLNNKNDVNVLEVPLFSISPIKVLERRKPYLYALLLMSLAGTLNTKIVFGLLALF